MSVTTYTPRKKMFYLDNIQSLKNTIDKLLKASLKTFNSINYPKDKVDYYMAISDRHWTSFDRIKARALELDELHCICPYMSKDKMKEIKTLFDDIIFHRPFLHVERSVKEEETEDKIRKLINELENFLETKNNHRYFIAVMGC